MTLSFDLYIDTIECLSEHGYAAFKVIETYNTWYEFTLIGNKVLVSYAQEMAISNDFFVFENQKQFFYPKWKNIEILFDSLKVEVISKSNLYISDLTMLNIHLVETNLIKTFIERLQIIEKKY